MMKAEAVLLREFINRRAENAFAVFIITPSSGAELGAGQAAEGVDGRCLPPKTATSRGKSRTEKSRSQLQSLARSVGFVVIARESDTSNPTQVSMVVEQSIYLVLEACGRGCRRPKAVLPEVFGIGCHLGNNQTLMIK